jgi:hypothetical protein
MVHLVTQSMSHTAQRRMVIRAVNFLFERIWMEVVLVWSDVTCRRYRSDKVKPRKQAASFLKPSISNHPIATILLWLYSPFLGLGRFFSFLILYTVGRTPWTGDQPVAGPLSTHRTTQTQNKCTQYRHPCLEWDSNPRSQHSSGRRQFMP